jgi:peptidoglycan/xylan/chitin deacetylase (PgdA/CDA1 family)
LLGVFVGKANRVVTFTRKVLPLAYTAPATRPGRILFRAITRLRSDDAVALTFDDGPDYELDRFLGVLEEAGAQATFFVVGEQVERAPSKLGEIVSCGHEVAVHCYRHLDHRQLAPDQVVEDMRRARAIIEDAAERSTELFRPPWGCFSLASWLEASRQGWERVLWTRDAGDWEVQATPQSIVANVGWPEGGDIFLLHDSDRYGVSNSCDNTLQALPFILERISTCGLEARSIRAILDAERR